MIFDKEKKEKIPMYNNIVENKGIAASGNIMFTWETQGEETAVKVFKMENNQVFNEVRKVNSELVKVLHHDQNILGVCGDEKITFVLTETDNCEMTVWKWVGAKKTRLLTTNHVNQFFAHESTFYATISDDSDRLIVEKNGRVTYFPGNFQKVKIFNSKIYAVKDNQICMYEKGRFKIVFKGVKIVNNFDNSRHRIHDYNVTAKQIIVVLRTRVVYYNLQTRETRISKINADIQYYPTAGYFYPTTHFCNSDFFYILRDNLFTICNVVNEERQTFVFPCSIQSVHCFDGSRFYFSYNGFICEFDCYFFDKKFPHNIDDLVNTKGVTTMNMIDDSQDVDEFVMTVDELRQEKEIKDRSDYFETKMKKNKGIKQRLLERLLAKKQKRMTRRDKKNTRKRIQRAICGLKKLQRSYFY